MLWKTGLTRKFIHFHARHRALPDQLAGAETAAAPWETNGETNDNIELGSKATGGIRQISLFGEALNGLQECKRD